ncbi:sensor histidine kinase [Neorickettsia findlayensis]|uniref:histidine kinase n=1 Tax=Neorickettsia findlayensis TaxID=2686014 RepID=A0A6P1G9T9_9RICK|nr:HAMP domain-containing sensor histidine kinase [Neorickettsia findlayensis]QHD65249.1 sensor histidine kinase [Neorickettsia findlayensis]
MIFHKHDLKPERCIRYVKFLLSALAVVSFYFSLNHNKDAITNYNTIRSIESSVIFSVAQNTIESFYSAVQNEISIVRFLVESGTPIGSDSKYLSTLLQYGEFIKLGKSGKVTDYEVGSIQTELFKDMPGELVTIENISLKGSSCLQHENFDQLDGEVRRMVYYLPAGALMEKLKEVLIGLEGKQNFSIVDKNYNEIYRPAHTIQDKSIRECRSIYSSLDNELYFCQYGASHVTFGSVIARVISILLPLCIVLWIFIFLKRLEFVFVDSKPLGSTRQDTKNPSILDQIATNSSHFISCITHELRTPLNVIIAFSEMIKDECLGNITNKKYVCYGQEIYKFGTSLLRTVDNIIDITKSNSMLMIPKKDYVGVQQIIAEAVRNCKTFALTKEISLCKSIDADLPEVFLDREQVKKAITNILSNAIKFSENGATVSIRACQNCEEGSISITIEDSGSGMKVVNGVPQLENSLTKKADGLGIGLLLSRNIIHLNNGSLEIYSQVGKGTRTTITFKQKQAD